MVAVDRFNSTKVTFFQIALTYAGIVVGVDSFEAGIVGGVTIVHLLLHGDGVEGAVDGREDN